jgi:hypothetical protein
MNDLVAQSFESIAGWGKEGYTIARNLCFLFVIPGPALGFNQNRINFSQIDLKNPNLINQGATF